MRRPILTGSGPVPARGALARSGFTLIEMMAVLLILSILFVFVITRVLGSKDTVLAENTRQFLSMLEASIGEYELEFGDYPPSTFPEALESIPNQLNAGAEMLFLSLYSKDWQSRELPDERLGNSDGDSTRRSLSSFSSTSLFEIQDDWGNPIAYIHRRDYDKEQTYVSSDSATGEAREGVVKGRTNPRTGDPYNRTRFQLVSAGPDGAFGTEDDIENFER